MSKPFEDAVAQWFLSQGARIDVEPGDRYVGEFPDDKTATNICRALLEQADETEVSVNFEGRTETMPAITINGTPVILVRVRQSKEDVTEQFEATRAYATTLRNVLSEQADDNDGAALLLFYEPGVVIETLETTHVLFASDSRLPLSEFEETVRSDLSTLSKQGKAIVRVVDDRLDFPADPMVDLGPLQTFCEIRDACERTDGDQLCKLVPDIGTYLREETFNETWFEDNGHELDDLVGQAEQILNENNEHAKRIAQAKQVTKDTRTELAGHYTDEFVRRVDDEDDWQQISRHEAKDGVLDPPEPKGNPPRSTGTGGDKPTSPGGSGSSSKEPEFENVIINEGRASIYSGYSDDVRRDILVVADSGTVQIETIFTADVSGEPIELVDSAGQRHDYYKTDGDIITVQLDRLPSDKPEYYSLNVYLGYQQRRGTPACEINIAVLPEWFYKALDDTTVGVAVANEALEMPDEERITLRSGDSEDEDPVVTNITDDDQLVTLDKPRFLRPRAPPRVERLRCKIVESDSTTVPVSIDFVSEVEDATIGEVQFPLSLAAVISPDDWASQDLQPSESIVVNTERGEIHSPSRGLIELPDRDKKLLQIEQVLVKDGKPEPRKTDATSLESGVIDAEATQGVDARLLDAYQALFNHFDERDTTPSTDPWDADTVQRAQAVVNTYEACVDEIEPGSSPLALEPYRHIGTIRSESTATQWLTPFHPLMLAYAIQLAEWRGQLTAEGRDAGFRFERFTSLFSPAGFMPYRWSDHAETILSGHQMMHNALWAYYELPGEFGAETPQYMDNVLADKLEAFVRAFPTLFKIHPERTLRINLVDMGDLAPVIDGLYEFFQFMKDYPETSVPQIELYIYGERNEGEALDRFFATDSTSSLRERLSKGTNDTVDLLDKRVSYVLVDQDYTEKHAKPAHLTIFRGLLEEKDGSFEMDNFPTTMRLNGLLPREHIDIERGGDKIVSRSGAAFHTGDTEVTAHIGRIVNSIEAGASEGAYTPSRSLSKRVKAAETADLTSVWDQSLWALHVEPRVGLEFYIHSTNEAGNNARDTLMIHYSDQYDSASPGFDVITTTNKRDPYIEALRRELDQTAGLQEVDPEAVLTRLIGIDGELPLDIQQADENTTIELLGLVGGLAFSNAVLEQHLSDYVWIPISLAEFARHDRSYRRQQEGLLQYFANRAASDDLCFVGMPQQPDQDNLTIKMWIVETKGGTSAISKGVDQVKGARENLKSLFEPDEQYADTELMKSEFGEVLLQIAQRLYHYGVISQDQFDAVNQHTEQLVDATYQVDLLEDAHGNIGEVVAIKKDIAIPQVGASDEVRIIELPTDILSLINEPATLNEIHQEINLSSLSFQQTPTSTDTRVRVADRTTDSPQTNETDGRAPDTGRAESSEVPTDGPLESDRADDPENTVEDTRSVEPGNTVEHSTESGTKTTKFTEKPSEHDIETAYTTNSTPQSTETDSHAWQKSDLRVLAESLQSSPESDVSIDVSQLTSELKRQFESLGVEIHEPNPAEVSIGPRKLGVNVSPKPGQKIESVMNALDSISVQIGASGTITGKANPEDKAIRLEIPHGNQRDIYLREGFEALGEQLRESLTFPLGVNTENDHKSIDLLTEHHALIGGATGSGKSNFLSTVICSLAAAHPPDRLRLSLLDPKGIDFQRFASFPHVDTFLNTPEDCVDYLHRLLEEELEQRRNQLQEAGVASVQEYNELAESRDFEPIPYRVIIIDEFADLIMSLSGAQEEFESAVGRIAQIGRALGYSILLATQRPSADIVSGDIKTNFNCRISFELPSATDSRVILDQDGAEDLEGAGDMIAIKSNGDELHLQAYRLLPDDALTIRERLSQPDQGSAPHE